MDTWLMGHSTYVKLMQNKNAQCCVVHQPHSARKFVDPIYHLKEHHV